MQIKYNYSDVVHRAKVGSKITTTIISTRTGIDKIETEGNSKSDVQFDDKPRTHDLVPT